MFYSFEEAQITITKVVRTMELPMMGSWLSPKWNFLVLIQIVWLQAGNKHPDN